MLNRFHVYYNVSVKGQKERLPLERSKRAKRQRRSDLGIPKKESYMEEHMNRVQLEQCINDYGKDIYAFCSRMTASRQDAEELYQDTFLKAVELAGKIDFDNNPKSYLVSIAMRLWKNRKRKYAWRARIAGMKQYIDEELPEDAENKDSIRGNPVEESWIDKELKILVRDAVAGLEEKYRIPVYLYYTMQFSVSEIAELMKIPEGTVKNRLYQARSMLKPKLEVVWNEL